MVGHMYSSSIRPPATPLGKVKNCCRQIFSTAPIQIFGLRTPQILTSWIIMYGALLRKMPSTAITTKAQLVNIIKADFETLPRESVTSACTRFWGQIEAVVDANGGYFE